MLDDREPEVTSLAIDPAATLVTTRLALEPLRIAHAAEMAPVLNDQRLHAFTGGAPLSATELHTRYERWVGGRSADGRARWLNWIARTRASGQAVGALQATVTADPVRRAELAWTIGVGFQGRGYAREGASAVADWLTGQRVSELVAHIHPDHIASIQVARAIGLIATDRIVEGEVRWVRTAPR